MSLHEQRGLHMYIQAEIAMPEGVELLNQRLLERRERTEKAKTRN